MPAEHWSLQGKKHNMWYAATKRIPNEGWGAAVRLTDEWGSF